MIRTTVESLAEYQIRGLRRESAEAGDLLMVVICDVALDERADDISDYAWFRESKAQRDRVWELTQDEANTLVVEAINSAEAMVK